MKKVLLFMISILVIGVLAACGSSDNGSGEEKKVLKMATSADYPPFEYIDTAKGSDIIGFDVDLAKAIGKELGYEIKVEDMDFTGLIPALQAKKADMVLAGMTPTEERKKSVDFSDVYYTAKHMIISKKGSGIKSVEDLEGKTVGVQLSSIQEGKAEELAKEVNIKVENRNRIPELIQEMKSGRFDAAIIEDTVAKGYFEKDKELEGITIEDGETEEAGSAIAFPKDSKYTEEFNKVLQEMKENGELEKLVVKWFGGEAK
ncbi:transporter substrate-binding domain-containing protein [Bacillus sp. CMF21]|uniref:transporter substrate-binding domain-containing protein n=1 Tax=Metabacillus dongyingensis TaxID=2874282 RepID=UPI001CC170BF|nr:transporter substrate-binding domain-containing protein [Metabacillus dongyingensis]UAL50950.1 transporter substrate-binding domain-containing protein [Metabacillus dongyingensis]UOK56970.1 transporter substrate-binding domain-containing protein [Bacillus sp. OVS6]USK27226.1 transporter substrate-binding domain-containing protein [Bacillus sp. CMF21]